MKKNDAPNFFSPLLASCKLCHRRCGINRLAGEIGFCRAGILPRLALASLHYWEEPCISGSRGSGTVFFSRCNLACVYCQNHSISQEDQGIDVSVERLAEIFLELQQQGAHNLNLVTPTPYVPQIIAALSIARSSGLRIPAIYNTSSYETQDAVDALRGWIDIYLPDLKYSDDLLGLKYSQARSYVDISRQAVQEMFRQVGLLETDEQGLAIRGLIVRHLILPHDLAGSESTLKFLAEEVSRYVNVSLMSQYYPTNKSEKIPKLSRKINQAEYDFAVEMLEKYRLEEGYWQEFESSEVYRPDFNREKPFDHREVGLCIS